VDVGKFVKGKRREAPGGLVLALSFKGRSLLTPTEARAFVDPVHLEYAASVHLVLRGTGIWYYACYCIRSIFVVIVARVIGTGRGGGWNGGGGDDDDGVDEGITPLHPPPITRRFKRGHRSMDTSLTYHTCQR
jgi:hypothetical protein